MKKILIQIKLLLVLVACMLTTSVFGATYYVATNGNDNSTSPTNPNYPWQTIQKAANTVPGGSTVSISGGTYYEKVTIGSRCNGTSSVRTVFQSKSGQTAIINGNNSGYQCEALLALTGVQYVTVKGIKATNRDRIADYSAYPPPPADPNAIDLRKKHISLRQSIG
jgi:hypothetical protein